MGRGTIPSRRSGRKALRRPYGGGAIAHPVSTAPLAVTALRTDVVRKETVNATPNVPGLRTPQSTEPAGLHEIRPDYRCPQREFGRSRTPCSHGWRPRCE